MSRLGRALMEPDVNVFPAHVTAECTRCRLAVCQGEAASNAL